MRSTTPSRWLMAAWSVMLAPALLLERTRGRRRLALFMGYAVVVAAVGLFVWRASSLSGLPDVGDPFDVEAFTTVEITAEENAFTLYRQASAMLRLREVSSRFGRLTDFDWSRADPDLRRWVEENREARTLWRRGAERARGVDFRPGDREPSSPLNVPDDLRNLARMGLLNASRLEQAGDLSGAWNEYRAALRSSRHIGMAGNVNARMVGRDMLRQAIPRVLAWADDPRVDAGLLRRAVADVRFCEAMTPPPSVMFRAEYLTMRRILADRSRWPMEELCPPSHWYYQLPRVAETKFWLRREPERSRRIVRLIFANWLAYCDRPRDRQPGLVPGVSIPMLFQVDATAPPQARALRPEALDAWYQSAPMVPSILTPPDWAVSSVVGEPGQLRSLRMILAEQCYRREHGGVPPTRLGELVGRYLDALPEGYADDDPPVTPDEPSSDENGRP